MIKKVQIIEIDTNIVIAEYPIELVGDDFEEDYFAEAWENAIDDGLVEDYDRSNYLIEFVDKDNEDEENKDIKDYDDLVDDELQK